MAVDFGAILKPETKKAILESRIQAFAADGWQHELNLKAAQALGNDAAIAEAEAAIVVIGDAIAMQQAELDSLNVSVGA